jgi:hypothetical protein
MTPRVSYDRAWKPTPWALTFDPGITLHFGTFERAVRFAGKLNEAVKNVRISRRERNI